MVADVGPDEGAHVPDRCNRTSTAMKATVALEHSTGGGTETAPDWEAIRAAYEGGEGTVIAICRRFRVTPSALAYRARRDLWRMRNKRLGASGPALLARTYRLLERQIFEMEKAKDPMGEMETGALHRVAATLEKLMDIERRETAVEKRQPAAPPSRDLEYLRAKIAARIDELERG